MQKRMVEDKNEIEQRMKILNNFKQSITENHTMIDKIYARVEENNLDIKEFKLDDVYIKSRSNYAKLYAQLAE